MEPDLRNLGLFGGTFDPPHESHRRLAMAALEHGGIDRLLVVPCNEHPWKRGSITASPDDRLALCRLAFAEIDGLDVSAIEIEHDGPSYTVETVERLRTMHPGVRIKMLVGADNVEGLSRWHRGNELLSMVDLLIYPRDGSSRPTDLPARSTWLDLPADDVSSTQIRDELALGQRPAALRTSVFAEIHRRDLYRGTGD